MRALGNKLKPANGFAYYAYIGLTSLLPILVYVFVQVQFVSLAVAVILLSKWRMFAVRPRYWATNIRSNAVDIIVGLSVVLFMSRAESTVVLLAWTLGYAVWLLLLKPQSGVLMVSLQALIGQFLGLTALFLVNPDAPLILLVIGAAFVCYVSARHFFTSFDEKYGSLFAHVWAYSGAALTWVLGHWLLFYGSIAQPTLLLSVIGFGLAGMYYLDEHDRLSDIWRRQFVFIMVAVVVVVLAFSDWGDKTY